MPDTPTHMRIFVSHSSADNDACRALVSSLRGAGADVWYDEHNLGAGQLLEEIQREVLSRPVFLILLSKSAFAAAWVKREASWAFNLLTREPQRVILPITVGPIEPADFNTWLFLEDFKRVEARGMQPLPTNEAIQQTLKLLALTAKGEAQVPIAPQPGEGFSDILTRGKALQAQKKHTLALPFFERATQLDPNSFDAWANLGYTLGVLKRSSEALRADDRATSLDPNNADAWYNKGITLRSLGRHKEAIAAYDRALTLEPNLAAAWSNMGTVLMAMKRYKEALTAFDRALAIEPDEVIQLNNKGLALMELGRDAAALLAFEQALVIDPDYDEAWHNKGVALEGLRRYEEALTAYEQALAIDPNRPNSWRGKANMLANLGWASEAHAADRLARDLGG